MIDKLKKSWKSWTIWLNALALGILPFLPDLANSLPQLEPYLPQNLYKWVMVLVLVANIGMRFRTSTALQNK